MTGIATEISTRDRVVGILDIEVTFCTLFNSLNLTEVY